MAVRPNANDVTLKQAIQRVKEKSLRSGRMMVLDVTCEKDGFSFVNAQGKRQTIQYKKKKENGGRTGQCEERSTEDDHRKCRSGKDARVVDERHHAKHSKELHGARRGSQVLSKISKGLRARFAIRIRSPKSG